MSNDHGLLRVRRSRGIKGQATEMTNREVPVEERGNPDDAEVETRPRHDLRQPPGIASHLRQATVDEQLDARDVAALVRCEERHCSGDVFRAAEAAERDPIAIEISQPLS